MTRAHLRMTGCRLNQAELDAVGRQLQAQGHTLTDDPTTAQWHVVNTCAVTQQATASSRKLIRELHRANPDAHITVTGCYAHLAPDEVRGLAGVVRVVDNTGKDTLVQHLTGQPPQPFDHEPLAREAGVTRTRAFVKVQDGCDNACTARGAGRTRPFAEVVDEVRGLLAMGYSEVVLTGVHLGSTGHDLGLPNGLYELVRLILRETDLPRLRLSSVEPWDLHPDFFTLWADARVCRHLHLPLQSGSDRTLKRMLRRTTQAQFSALLQAARAVAPDLCVTSDVIAGFPGETDADFDESLAFVERCDFAGLHVFPYSPRAGTAAARMRGHVREEAKKARVARLIAHGAAQHQRFMQRFVGQIRPVLWENVAGATPDGFVNVGYTDNYLRVGCVHPRPLTGLLTPARLGEADGAHLRAQPLDDWN
ncbi:MAG: MiaB/RimO family radical SAM methylthiotransferase [Anaerolineae bacterium]|nr:MiaB/RimO family radical SAM methylthiotransferase [Anaerolineae bacterium]